MDDLESPGGSSFGLERSAGALSEWQEIKRWSLAKNVGHSIIQIKDQGNLVVCIAWPRR